MTFYYSDSTSTTSSYCYASSASNYKIIEEEEPLNSVSMSEELIKELQIPNDINLFNKRLIENYGNLNGRMAIKFIKKRMIAFFTAIEREINGNFLIPLENFNNNPDYEEVVEKLMLEISTLKKELKYIHLDTGYLHLILYDPDLDGFDKFSFLSSPKFFVRNNAIFQLNSREDFEYYDYFRSKYSDLIFKKRSMILQAIKTNFICMFELFNNITFEELTSKEEYCGYLLHRHGRSFSPMKYFYLDKSLF